MKLIQFQGDLYEVPHMTTHMARDADMRVWAFDHKPKAFDGYSWKTNGGDCVLVMPLRKDVLRMIACEEI